MKINYIQGDLFQNIKNTTGQNIFICHVNNNLGAWGSGFVVPLGKYFPESKAKYINWHRTGVTQAFSGLGNTIVPDKQIEFKLGNTQFVQVAEAQNDESGNNIFVANMVAQEGVGAPRALRYNALASCMDQVATGILNMNPSFFGKSLIHSPLFGSALAGGRWEFIAEIIKDCWLRKDISVNIHYFPEEFQPPI